MTLADRVLAVLRRNSDLPLTSDLIAQNLNGHLIAHLIAHGGMRYPPPSASIRHPEVADTPDGCPKPAFPQVRGYPPVRHSRSSISAA